MTAGYDPSGVSRPPDQPGEPPRHAAADGSAGLAGDTGRLGPLPPRMTSTGSFPTVSPPPPPPGFPPTGSFPVAPVSPYATSGQPFSGAPVPGPVVRRSRLGGIALIFAIVLAIVAITEGVFIYRLNGRIDDTNHAAQK